MLETEIRLEIWIGRVFRMVKRQYAASSSLMNGEGAFRTGGRWNPPGIFRANYCSLQPGTAAEEAIRLFEASGFAKEEIQPRVFAAIRYKLQRTADLTKVTDAQLKRIMALALAEDWKTANRTGTESLGQCVGRLAFELGFEAILVPSGRVRSGHNLVVFPEKMLAGSEAAADGVDILEKLAAS